MFKYCTCLFIMCFKLIIQSTFQYDYRIFNISGFQWYLLILFVFSRNVHMLHNLYLYN